MPKYRRGSGSIYRRGKMWWLSYYTKDGRHVCESAKTRDKGEARDELQKKIGQRAEDRLVVGADKVTFEDLIAGVVNDYKANGRKSLDKIKSRSKHLAKSFAGWRARDITTAEIRAFVAKRQEDGAGNGEINRELALLRRGFSLALEAEKITRRPYIVHLEEPSPRTGFFEPEAFNVIVKHLPPHLIAVMTFAYLTGWRCRSEVLPLPWRNVDFDGGTIRLDVGSTKNKAGRVIHMTKALRDLLEAQRRHTLEVQRKTGRVIPLVFHNNGRPIVSYYKAWHRACEAAKVSGRVPHDFRRTAVRNMVRAGISERVAMQMAGHKTRSVFDRYHIVSDGDLQEAARKLEAAMPTRTATVLATATTIGGEKTPSTIGNS
jgi:integrase